MRLTVVLAMVFAGLVRAQVPSTQAAPTDLDFRAWINRGVQAIRAARTDDAIEAFQHAVQMKPDDPNGHLYLGTAYMQTYIPGAQAPENLANAARAEAELRRVLDLDQSNSIALASLGSLSYFHAGSEQGDGKLALLEQSRGWYRQLLAIDPENKEPYYWLGVLAWTEFYPALMQARTAARMRPEDPGPISNAGIRRELAGRYTPLIEEGIAQLKKAMEIDPLDEDAISFLNLLIRERADLRDTKDEYVRGIAEADDLVRKALDVKKAAARAQSPSEPRNTDSGAPAPPPPPAPRQIRASADVQDKNLLHKLDPVCSPRATAARIQGDVKLSLTIGSDGIIRDVKVVSGHPLLIPQALEAVKQWRYAPTLLDGEPVEVIAPVDIHMACVNP